MGLCLTAQTIATTAFATSQVSPQLAAEGVKIVVVHGTKCVDINGTLSDCDPKTGYSAVGNSTLVGISHPAIYPQINMATISNTTVPVSNATNATSATNEHDYKWGFSWAISDYTSSSKDSGLSSYVDSNNDVDYCQVARSKQIALPGITNSTACRDGYVAGWKSWCKSDGLDCAYWAATGTYPSLIAHAQKMDVPCVPWCLDRQFLAKGYHNNSTHPQPHGAGIARLTY